MVLDQFGRGDARAITTETAETDKARQPIFDALTQFDADLHSMNATEARKLRKPYKELRVLLSEQQPARRRQACPDPQSLRQDEMGSS